MIHSLPTFNQDNSLEWQLNLIQHLDVGIVVLDKAFTVRLWNTFMVNHSGISAEHMLNAYLFSKFTDLPEDWLRRKIQTVIMLDNSAFTTWEERPWLFKFKSYRPITGSARHMYQNATLLPLKNAQGEVDHVAIIIYDVTDAATNRLSLLNANQELSRLSITDQLTGLSNRGYLESCIKSEFERFCRTQQKSSLVMLDIDYFKKVNDTHGHLVGDEVIRKISKCITMFTRTTDLAGRYGGEEFAILLINTPIGNAKIFAERLREAIENTVIQVDNLDLYVTVSLGISVSDKGYTDYNQWLNDADQALYRSKERGRNQVTLADYD
jgi:diguanylate cyclase